MMARCRYRGWPRRATAGRCGYPLRLLGALLLAAATATAAGSASAATTLLAQAGANDLVWCANAARTMVLRKPAFRCQDAVVDDAEAARIERARVERIQRVLQRERESPVPGRRLTGSGSGFYVSGDGHVLTNRHVIENCAALTVTPVGAGELLAQLSGVSREVDLALLRTQPTGRPAAVLRRAEAVRAGEAVTVVGYPLQGKVVIEPTDVHGQVHGTARVADGGVFAIRADIRSGHSGGPVLDDAGRVIGVVFAAINTPEVFARSGRLVRDVGLGIRLGPVRRFLRAQGVAAVDSDSEARLDPQARHRLAREFVAQVRCWR